MSLFSTVAQKVEQGFDWGVTAASRAASSAATATNYAVDKNGKRTRKELR